MILSELETKIIVQCELYTLLTLSISFDFSAAAAVQSLETKICNKTFGEAKEKK